MQTSRPTPTLIPSDILLTYCLLGKRCRSIGILVCLFIGPVAVASDPFPTLAAGEMEYLFQFKLALVVSLVLLASLCIAILREISAKRIALKKLREEMESSKRQALLLEQMSALAKIGGWQFESDTGKLMWTEEVAKIHGLSPTKETSLETGLSYYEGEHLQRIQSAIKLALESGVPYDIELQLTLKDGSTKWVRSLGRPTRDSGGKIIGLHGAMQDVTLLHQTLRRLRESESLYSSLVTQLPVGVYRLDQQGRFVFINATYSRFTGMRAEDCCGQTPSVAATASPRISTALAAHASMAEEHHAALMAGAERFETLECLPSEDGAECSFEVLRLPIVYDQGRVVGSQGILVDVTGRRLSEKRALLGYAATRVLAESFNLENTARRFIATLGGQLGLEACELWMADSNRSNLTCIALEHPVGPNATAFTEASRHAHTPVDDGLKGIVWKSSRPEWFPDVQRHPSFIRADLTRRLRLKSALGVPVLVRETIVGVLLCFWHHNREPDPSIVITLQALASQFGQFYERATLEDRYRHTQKLEAVGILAGSIAHDFNNILTAITCFNALAQHAASEGKDVRPHLDEIDRASKRAADLVGQILAFSRRSEKERKPTRIQNIVKEAVNLLRTSAPPPILFELELDDATPEILANESQLHQIVMNLGTNALHAMTGRSGSIHIRVRPSTISRDGTTPRPAAQLIVEDCGSGMDERVVKRIFEPFYTTKQKGEGTGLGLSVVHGIVEEHGGLIEVRSSPAIGTTFTLTFPAATSKKAIDVAGA